MKRTIPSLHFEFLSPLLKELVEVTHVFQETQFMFLVLFCFYVMSSENLIYGGTNNVILDQLFSLACDSIYD